MDWVFQDLPVHPLVVHLTVVLIPVAALTVVLAAVWPAARRRLGLLPPILSLLALIMVPITTAAGTWLAERVGRTPLVDRHEALGTSILPWVVAMFVVAIAGWVWHKFASRAKGRVRLAVSVILAAAAVVIAAGSVVTIVQIGESGAKAVWTGNFSEDPIPAP